MLREEKAAEQTLRTATFAPRGPQKKKVKGKVEIIQ
jgi:hypothetical protein